VSLGKFNCRVCARDEAARLWSDMNDPKRLPLQGHELISLAQKLARDAERHAILSASLASQADRLMLTGLRLLDPPVPTKKEARLRP